MDATMQLESPRPNYHRVEDYFGTWSMYEPAFSGLFSLITDMNLMDHVNRRTISESVQVDQRKIQTLASDRQESGGEPRYQVTPGGIAIFRASGTLMKSVSSFSSSQSTVQLRQAMRAAGRDPNVMAAICIFDTPGGTVAGTSDLAAEWAALGQIKPTSSYIEDLCASAGYWVASQGNEVSANPTAMVGSIGTYAVVHDTSARAEAMKIKVHVIKAGEYKGVGVPGTEVKDEHLDMLQKLINDQNDQFVKGVAKGRKLSLEQARSLADGRMHVGEAAQKAALIDSVQSFDETLRQLQERAGKKGSSQKGTSKMTETTKTVSDAAPLELRSTAATLGELKAHLKGADADFLLKQLEGNVTIQQAQSNWISEQSDRLAAKEKELADAKAATGKHPGTKGLGEGKSSNAEETQVGDSVQAFSDLVLKFQTDHKMTRTQAVYAAAKKNPELHMDFLSATNPGKKSKRLINEKYRDE